MSFKNIVKRELEFAFSPTWHPICDRVIKYAFWERHLYFYDKGWFWIALAFCLFSLITHFWARYKTRGWTQSYGKWKYFKSKYDEEK
jgi:hypothetical protein